jgi:hypothetical protein
MSQVPGGTRTTTLGVVLGNAVPLIGVFAFGWGLHSILVAYWLESGVVGGSFVAKIRRSEGTDNPDGLPSMSFDGSSIESFIGRPNKKIASYFIGHYSFFWVVHGVFVFFYPLFLGIEFASPRDVLYAMPSLVAYHAVSYWINFIGGGEYERMGPVTLMVEPYRRVLVLHLTILGGGRLVILFGTPVGLLAALVVLKTVLDLRGHWSEHDRSRQMP